MCKWRIVFAWVVYSYFEKGFAKMCMRQSQKVLGCCRTYFCCFALALADMSMTSPACHSFKFLWKTVNSKPPTIPFGVVACTLSDNLSRNTCINVLRGAVSTCATRAEWNRDFLWQLFVSLFNRGCCVMKGSYRGIMQFGQIDSEIKLYLVPLSFKSISIKIVNINCWLG